VVAFHLLGVSEFRAAIDASIARQLAATRKATATAAHLVETRAKEHLTESSHPRGTPTPSLPGHPPALVSGTLRRSVRVEGPTTVDGTSFTASVGPTAVYGRAQELGDGPLPARPFLTPALQYADADITALYEAAWSTW
jgi:hypothetical protein